MKRKIGDVVKDTQAYGTVEILDVYSSDVTPDHWVYEIETEDGGIFLAYEKDLQLVF